ncbi:unnamed protein product [Rhizophagus irregularis]|uniref:Uncharacterized protein n=2 Tax=Rhizophagus irregularis TaxID=588596 RepID=A0A915ZUI7_9GLOM|nr:hypothetical protein RirG_057400 [Rhizophagus irregularis DAOM 197198w]GBC46567.1 zinc finger BED domain-containing protein 1-like [Rhizophagus irregularis DAOM 181602=DAOM 197198]CAB4484561.1 unnamed protein product [Rhizophagus irregularis]CAB5387727.1 unnamed protein product [Rhizophagus irregularis]
MKSNQQELREPQPKQSLKRSKSRIYKKSLFSDDESNDNMEFEENQIERYLVMAQIQNDQNPLKWWDVSERVFSDAGLIMSAKRTSMKEDLFEALIFLKRNGELVGGMFNNNNTCTSIINVE